MVHTHPEMQQLGFKHLQEVLGVEPAFYVHSIANRRSCILAVEYVCNGRSSKLCWSFTWPVPRDVSCCLKYFSNCSCKSHHQGSTFLKEPVSLPDKLAQMLFYRFLFLLILNLYGNSLIAEGNLKYLISITLECKREKQTKENIFL